MKVRVQHDDAELIRLGSTRSSTTIVFHLLKKAIIFPPRKKAYEGISPHMVPLDSSSSSTHGRGSRARRRLGAHRHLARVCSALHFVRVAVEGRSRARRRPSTHCRATSSTPVGILPRQTHPSLRARRRSRSRPAATQAQATPTVPAPGRPLGASLLIWTRQSSRRQAPCSDTGTGRG